MSQAIETLMHEHRLIVRVMGSLETFARRVGDEGLGDRARLGDMERLSMDFERIERQETGTGGHERLHALADSLIAAFPPARDAAGCACQG